MNELVAKFDSWKTWKATLEKIYNTLGDDISRDIYKRRLMHSLFGEREELKQMVREARPKSKALEAPKLCFYGAGKGAEWFLDRKWNWMLKGAPSEQPVIDNYKTGTIRGHQIITFEEFLKIPDYKDYIVIITLGDGPIRQKIEEQLNEYGLQYLMAYSDLNWTRVAYFDLPYIDFSGVEYFVDGGGYDGETTEIFYHYCPKGHAYVFEPNPEQFEIVKERLKDYPNVELFPYGMHDKESTVRFDTWDSQRECACISENGNIEIETRKLDDLLRNRKVTFIKMDIEGVELAALRGAEQIIREQRPKLAICIYHKPEDIWEIPSLILQYHPDYKFYLRHYTLWDSDTVLFAI